MPPIVSAMGVLPDASMPWHAAQRTSKSFFPAAAFPAAGFPGTGLLCAKLWGDAMKKKRARAATIFK